jgi:hypothetical protein
MSKLVKLLYPEIETWFHQYLKDHYKGSEVITTHQTSRVSLDAYLKTLDIEIKEAIGLSIKIDVVGVLKKGDKIDLAFVEVKNGPLTLRDLGQLLVYTQLINPAESFLMSPSGLGSLDYLLNILQREDLLVYGSKKERMMKICKWDKKRKTIDYFSLLPKR